MKIFYASLLISSSLAMFVPRGLGGVVRAVFGPKFASEFEKPIEKAFTRQELDNIETVFATLSVEHKKAKLFGLLGTPEVEAMINDPDASVAIYDKLAKLKVSDHSELIDYLKETIFNRGFPDRFETPQEILAFRWKRPETLQYLIKSKAFEDFVSDDLKFAKLLEMMKVENFIPELNHKWNLILPQLENIQTGKTWISRALTESGLASDKDFINYVRDEENAANLFKYLRKTPTVNQGTMLLVKKAAFGRYFSEFSKYDLETIAEVVLHFKESNALGVLANFEGYNNFVKDPFQAYQLEKLLLPFFAKNNEGKFIKQLHKAATTNYFSSHQIIKSLQHSDWDLFRLTNFKGFQAYIDSAPKMVGLVQDLKKNPENLELIKINTDFKNSESLNLGLQQKKFIELLGITQ